MITLDDLLVMGMVVLAAGFLLRRVWRRLHPRTGAAAGGCAGCDGCGTAARPTRPCSSAPRDRPG